MDRVMQKATLSLLCLLFSHSALAASFSDIDAWGIRPNIGIDAGVRNQSFNYFFGKEHFRQNYPDTNIYFGIKFHPFFGTEIGYENMYRQQRQQFYDSGVPVLGFVPGTPTESMYISDVYSEGWNFNFVGYYPLCPRVKTELIAVIGIEWQKMYYSTVPVLDNNPATPLAMWESDSRAMLRLGLGIRQMITKHFGSRLQLLWEDTSKLGATFTVPFGQGGANPPLLLSDSYTAKPKDNYSVLLGFFFQVT